MSRAQIIAACEKSIDAFQPAQAVDSWHENDPDLTPTAGRPYQKIYVIFADPDAPEYGPNFQELGLVQVSLFYPAGRGWGDARDHADALCARFRRGTTITTADGVTITVHKPPLAPGGKPDGDRYHLPVTIPFIANVTA